MENQVNFQRLYPYIDTYEIREELKNHCQISSSNCGQPVYQHKPYESLHEYSISAIVFFRLKFEDYSNLIYVQIQNDISFESYKYHIFL